MEENEVLGMENEVMEGEVTDLMEVRKNTISTFAKRKRNSTVNCETITNIEDKKKLYNLSTTVDYKLNDCVGEKIRVKEVVIKFFEKPLKEPKINEETGEIIEVEKTVSCVLVDEAGKSYAAGSKSFVYQLLNFMDGGYITEKELSENGLDIEIIKKNIANSNNKALGFKVL